MSKELDAALEGRPWSLSGLLFGLTDILDDEGRPISERRAASAVKDGVPIVLKACPYRDARKGAPMNVSALKQIMGHLEEVISDVVTFRHLNKADLSGWDGMFNAVIDQLLSPALELLLDKNPRGPVSGITSVGHKLAAGFFGVLLKCFTAEAVGEPLEPSVQNFMDFVISSGVLIGQVEVCAGPLSLIERVSEGFLNAPVSFLKRDLESIAKKQRSHYALRAQISQLLFEQLMLGVFWERFDEIIEQQIFRHSKKVSCFEGKNEWMKKKLATSAQKISKKPPLVDGDLQKCGFFLKDCNVLSREAEQFFRRSMVGASLEAGMSGEEAVTEVLLQHLLDQKGALLMRNPSNIQQFSKCFSGYLGVYRRVIAELYNKEMQLREVLGMSLDIGVDFGTLVLPMSHTLVWFEFMAGRRLHCEISSSPTLYLAHYSKKGEPLPFLPIPSTA